MRLAYVPAEQAVHVAAPADETIPRPHGLHLSSNLQFFHSNCVPAGQFERSLSSTSSVSSGQLLHLVAPSDDHVLDGQGTHLFFVVR